ncbi:PAS domain-containing sensor histidine kinase [Bdellovibrio bacteriovorus]|uniref:PAS domain-containing sensor histidine kinase n=1 Tax=Bdellovibrio bacteriovorus TaxID=959 RepID=UPI0021D14CEB|nr:PAS domain-containing sensor histidine kinase [Bdellovibrio bacteriovorus]UXR64846.1 PAS domain-containing sensor histidine kinase [Bdellovibrio bacteriovorus]
MFRASTSEALPLLQTRRFSSILVQGSSDSEALEFLYKARTLQPMAPRLLIAEDLNEQEVREGINKAQVYRFMRWPLSEHEIWEQLELALQRHSMFLSRSLLLKESSHQNKQLEALTHSLEAMVEERTQYIEMSHHEESEKLNRERQLIRFIKDLATQTSFEDILAILRKELRKFHKMGDPILSFRLGGAKTFFLSFQSGHFTQTESASYFEFPKAAQVPSAELTRYFANHFGRPFIKAYVVPFELRLTSHLTSGQGEAILCIENSLNDKEMGPFVDFMSDRVRPLSMALDRVLLESQLSGFSYRWEKTFDGMRDPIAIVDIDYNVVRANRKFSDRFMHHKCYESFAHRQAACEGCPVPQAMKEGAPAAGQIQVDGRIYQVHSYPVLLDQSTRPTNVVNQYVDITQSRELYLRMLQSEKMGAIGMLAGHIAHELNNPLTGLRSLSQVLLQEADQGSNLHSDLVEIEKATARSQRIIKNLLDFSKGEDQPSEYISVDEVVERTLPMLKSALRTHRLEVDLETLGQTVFVEPHLLQQVVFNLINNACQAMKEAGRLSVRTRHDQGRIYLEIEDTGPGIPEDIRRRIFEPFFTTKKEGHGTGLGLSMSKSVIEKFGGTIEFRNVEPHGTCFVIVLPQRNAP